MDRIGNPKVSLSLLMFEFPINCLLFWGVIILFTIILKRPKMKQKLKTAIQFTKNLFVTGALTETSEKVEKEICRFIPKYNDSVIVEFGMGHGNITKEILRHVSPSSKVYAFEVKEEFCDHVAKAIKDDRLIIINDGAENMTKHVKERVDSIIASIPYSFFSKEKSAGIIQDSYEILNPNCYYSQVLYTKFNFKKFQPIFDNCELVKIPNFPTEYIYHCQKLTQ